MRFLTFFEILYVMDTMNQTFDVRARSTIAISRHTHSQCSERKTRRKKILLKVRIAISLILLTSILNILCYEWVDG